MRRRRLCLTNLIESLPTARLLLLVNYRPEYQHGWGSKTYYTQLRLDPLPPVSAHEFLHALLGNDPSLEALTQLLIARTEGQSLLPGRERAHLGGDGGAGRAPGAYRLARPLDGLQVPATVQAVLVARIDRLPPEEKHLLQTAAVMGTEVPWSLLQAIADEPDEALHRGLAHLQAAELLYDTRLFPEPEYTFTHALTHEVAYGSSCGSGGGDCTRAWSRSPRPSRPTRELEQVDRLAHHALRGEVWDKAITYGRQAGAEAYDRAAFHEAAASFEQALQALAHLPEDGETRKQAIDLRVALARPLDARGEYGRCLTSWVRPRPWLQALDDRVRLGQILADVAGERMETGDHDGAIAAGQQGLALAAELGESALQVRAS